MWRGTGQFAGSLLIADEVKPEAAEVIGGLNGIGCRTVMLTGDNEAIASDVAGRLGLSAYKASLLPQDKVGEVESLLRAKKSQDVLCFVGDGINDAPVLMRSDIGIAMGGRRQRRGDRGVRHRADERRPARTSPRQTHREKDHAHRL